MCLGDAARIPLYGGEDLGAVEHEAKNSSVLV